MSHPAGTVPIVASTDQRPAEAGELCTCGRQARVVYRTERFGEVGSCEVHDSGAHLGPCPFCGGAAHGEDRCPQYRLRL